MNSNKTILTVTQLTVGVKRMLEPAFADVWVTGEIIGFKRHTSGHLYFTLKDSGARLAAMVFRSQVRFLAVRPNELRDGQQVLCHGRLNLYEPHGAYKIIVDQMQLEGRGALLEKLEALKRKLAGEGLFDESRKQPLPFLPATIGIVTSETSAAIRDMMRIIDGRFPVHVKLYPAAVQGSEAAPDIVQGIRVLDRDPEVEVIIIGRGGGAVEDLLPFSDERVVRAVAEASTPIISAVGHEIDFPLCDFAADLRAPTPTAAGQSVVPDRTELQADVSSLGRGLADAMERRLDQAEMDLAARSERMEDLAARRLDDFDNRLMLFSSTLAAAHPAARLRQNIDSLRSLSSALDLAMGHCLKEREQYLATLFVQVEQLGPKSQLRRGYSVVRRAADGAVVRRAAEVECNDDLEIILHEGRLDSSVTGKHR
jgi:exodeoxyribonuclease VII large subunit